MLPGAGFLTNGDVIQLNNIEYLMIRKACSDQRIRCLNMRGKRELLHAGIFKERRFSAL